MSMLQERYRDFFDRCQAVRSPASMAMIESALAFADEKLAGLVRHNGVPLLDHSVNTAQIVVSEIGLGRNSTIATLLHDTVRLGFLSSAEAGERFGAACTDIIDGMTNISGINPKIADDQADSIRELIISYATDPRVILIKLADRLEVMRTLDIFPHEKQEKKSWESLNLYAKIAHKLGLYNIKSELEDLSLKYLHPADHANIVEKLSESAAGREKFISEFLAPIEEKLSKAELKYTIKSRTKSVYSIWSKMHKQGVPFEEVYDVFAIRIIIDCPREEEKNACWDVYSKVTDIYKPSPERLRDWIIVPKANGYESLQTTVVTSGGKWVEIQIRTERMDEVAERGIAAHWRYKGIADSSSTGAGSEVFVFTPTGDLRRLPEGATVLDFAFHIHTNVGATCTGGKVNGRNVSIRHMLKNGDVVQILTSKNQRPKADWLAIVHTTRARSKIKAYIREQEAEAAAIGREELERKTKNWKLPIAIDDAVTVLCKHYKLRAGTELYARIADAKIDIADTKDILVRHLSGETEKERRTIAAAIHTKPGSKPVANQDALIIDDRLSGIDYKFGKCCNPIFGDSIFGFVTVASGITIHRADCPNAARMRALYPYRILPAQWRDEAGQGAFRATIKVTAEDRTGIVNNIADIINQELRLNIRSINFSAHGGTLSGLVNVEVPGTAVLETLIHKILAVKGVQKAHRINNPVQ